MLRILESTIVVKGSDRIRSLQLPEISHGNSTSEVQVFKFLEVI